MKVWKKNLLALVILLVVCGGIYINWQYSDAQAVADLTDTLDANKVLSTDMLVMNTDEDLTEGAKSLVLEELVFYAIVKAERFSISDTEYAEGVVKYAEIRGMTVEQLEAYYDKAYIADNLLWDKVMYALRDMTTFITE